MSDKQLNSNMNEAKKNKKDEFYTQYSTIDDEIKHHQGNFKDQVVYCNCDNPEFSNFYLYFKDNFHKLGLKKLITSHINFEGSSYSISYDGANETRIELEGNGDFRSPECIELLKQSDIVVTNPPFSLFREFVELIMKHNKKFLIIGNLNAIKYKTIFPLIKNRQLWLGASLRSSVAFFSSPYDDIATSKTHKEGLIRVNGVKWFCNIKHDKAEEVYVPTKDWDNQIDRDGYEVYDNLDAIEVSKSSDVPANYKGLMGVPITFLDRFNSKQFEIVSFRYGDDGKDLRINGQDKYTRLIIRWK